MMVRVLGTLFVVWTVALGCRSKNAIVVSEVVVNSPRQLDDDVEDRTLIRLDIISQLKKNSMVRWEPEDHDGTTHVLKIRIGDVVDRPEIGGDFRFVEVRLRGIRGELSYRADGQGQPPHKLRESVVSGFVDAWKVIENQRLIDLETEPRWADYLTHSDWRVREFALERVAQKRVNSVVPVLISRLQDETIQRLKMRVIGVLAELKAKSAVAPLVAITRHQEPALLLQVLHALGHIGGKEALGFVVTVATGHSIEGVRQVATDILKGLQPSEDMNREAAQKPAP